ncbi:ribonuclease P protein component [Mycoplasmopsis gallopavonis]|uniref:Ribonuclease P protein component n=1 Tax=Mycoplasmopsis gallopavonis TaxID=76629 RepID=A0A449AZK9_9BACT|nr:ribonuclease P protein component [Mycoplasmopsis gallopavonis]RIV16285.1 ribonuclease P protein component [Mycoplasmopsis gallopavonis]VEU72958.1 ribonuclease P protein component [Mycoplasmopsis gallopavonis]
MQKKYRLRKNWEFNSVINTKKQLINKYVILYYRKSDAFKVGITVPKKFANSVGRNLYKRQLRAILHEAQIYDLNYEFVIIARKEFLNSDFIIKKAEIKNLFEKFRKNEQI